MRNLLLACLCVPIALMAERVSVERLEDIESHVEPGTWVLLDLDNTVMHSATQWGHSDWFYSFMDQRTASGASHDDAVRELYPEWRVSQAAIPTIATDESVVAMIDRLQAKGVKVMGVTHRQRYIMDATLRQLAGVGIDFRKTAPHSNWEWFDRDEPAVYRDGVLFVADYNDKGELIKEFLSRLGDHPWKVLFVDDSLRNVESVERAFARDATKVVGVHYRYERGQWNGEREQVAQLQKSLYHSILSDDQARVLLDAKAA